MYTTSIVKPTRRTIFRVYWISIYMFRTVFPSIIRSSRLCIQHQVYVIQVCWLHAISIVKPTRLTIFRVYWISIYMFRTVFPSIIRSSRLYIHQVDVIQVCWLRAISIVKPTRRTIFRVYWISIYMFRTVFPSIIRSSRLCIQRQVYVIQVRWLHAISIVKPTRRTIFRVYWISLNMFRTVFPSIIRISRLYIQHQVYVIQVRWLHA